MNKQEIEVKIKSLESDKAKIDKKINSLKIKLENNQEVEWLSIPGTDLEVTKEVLFKGKSYNEIIKLKRPGEELLTLKQIGIILENQELVKELKMDSKYSTNDDFFFKQPFKTNEDKGYVARFYSYSGRSYLYFYGDAYDSFRTLGLRWVRKRRKNA